MFIRDKNICQCCGRKSNRLNAHHINSFARYPSLRTSLNNGITLCYRHHKVWRYSAHNNAIWFAFWFKSTFPKRFRYLVDKLIKMGLKDNEDSTCTTK